jgi:hypothetical protein
MGQKLLSLEPLALPDVSCCSKTGHGFALQRNVTKGQEETQCTATCLHKERWPRKREKLCAASL